MKISKQFNNAASGFSLVELMVGMTIGLIGLIVMGQVFSVTEVNKRGTTSGGDAQQNGALALYLLDKDISQAGFGFNDPALMGCTTNAFSEALNQAYTYTLAPVLITQGAGNAPDRITIIYSTSTRTSAKTKIQAPINTTNQANNYFVASNYGFNAGDVIVVAEAGKACTQAQVTRNPADTTTINPAPAAPTYQIEHIANASITDINGNVSQSKYNRPGGITPPTGGYTPNIATIFNLSNAVANLSYSIDASGRLLSSDTNAQTNAVVAGGILDLQAQYGLDTVNNNQKVVDTYQNTVTTAQLGNVLSIRYGLIARIGKREPTCDVTTAVPTWAGGTFNNITTDADWKCYRYRVFEGTTVLRNLMWRLEDA